MAVRAPRLPGIRFETVVPPPSDILPRMDVAALVGFSASGPLHTPVAVEDMAQFTAIFGDDLTLAWDPAQGTNVRAHLTPAVRAFFRNGGRRCWIVRVAGEGASVNEFPIPGLVSLKDDGTLVPAVALARSEGSWSDSLLVGSALVSDPVPVISMASDFRSIVVIQDRPALVPGDLLRVPFDDAGLGLFFGVDSVSTSAPSAGSTRRTVATLQGSPLTLVPTRMARRGRGLANLRHSLLRHVGKGGAAPRLVHLRQGRSDHHTLAGPLLGSGPRTGRPAAHRPRFERGNLADRRLHP